MGFGVKTNKGMAIIPSSTEVMVALVFEVAPSDESKVFLWMFVVSWLIADSGLLVFPVLEVTVILVSAFFSDVAIDKELCSFADLLLEKVRLFFCGELTSDSSFFLVEKGCVVALVFLLDSVIWEDTIADWEDTIAELFCLVGASTVSEDISEDQSLRIKTNTMAMLAAVIDASVCQRRHKGIFGDVATCQIAFQNYDQWSAVYFVWQLFYLLRNGH